MDNKRVFKLFIMLVAFFLMLWGFRDGTNDRKAIKHKDNTELTR